MKLFPNSKFFFAPGFLGSPNDGDFLRPLGAEVHGVDFFSPKGWLARGNFPANSGFQNLAVELHEWMQSFSGKKYLVGYSFGGRVLAHVFLQNPIAYEKFFLISSHLGLHENNEKISRVESDAVWARKFLNEPWNKVLHEWNQQPVLATSKDPTRLEKNYDRRALYLAFSAFSLGVQENLEMHLMQHKEKIVYVCGSKDAKFVELAQNYQKIGLSTHCLVGSGHRVLQDAPELLLELIQDREND